MGHRHRPTHPSTVLTAQPRTGMTGEPTWKSRTQRRTPHAQLPDIHSGTSPTTAKNHRRWIQVQTKKAATDGYKHTALAVCTLLFCGTVSGILMLVDEGNRRDYPR